MFFRRFCSSVSKSLLPPSISLYPHFRPIPSPNFGILRFALQSPASANSGTSMSLYSTNSAMDNPRRHPAVSIPHPDSVGRGEIFRALEAALGSAFSSQPTVPTPDPLIVVISGPSGVGKDAVINRLREIREDLHFVVTATTRPPRPGEVDGKDYFFLGKEDFLEMIGKHELLEYALVYGDYKGIPKQQIRDYMAKGCDIVLRVDIQGAATLRRILKSGAVFVYLVAESEDALVRRLIGRKTETVEDLLMRVASAREELRHLNKFDYVVVNKDGELESSVRLIESIIEAEKAKVQQRRAIV